MSYFPKTRAAAGYAASQGRSGPACARAAVLIRRLQACETALDAAGGHLLPDASGPLRDLVLAARDLVGPGWLAASADDPDVAAFTALDSAPARPRRPGRGPVPGAVGTVRAARRQRRRQPSARLTRLWPRRREDGLTQRPGRRRPTGTRERRQVTALPLARPVGLPQARAASPRPGPPGAGFPLPGRPPRARARGRPGTRHATERR